MTSLKSLFKQHESPSSGYGTDKDLTHCYGDLYDRILAPYRESVKEVLEIGSCSGAAVKCFAEYFLYANVTGIDLDIRHTRFTHPRARFVKANGISPETPYELGRYYDFILEDASHHPPDQIKSFDIFAPYLRLNGIYIIENVHEYHHMALKEQLPLLAEKHSCILEWYDLRTVHGRFDDIVAVFRKVTPEQKEVHESNKKQLELQRVNEHLAKEQAFKLRGWRSPVKKYVYIHVAALNNWLEVFTDIITKLITHGVYNEVNEIRVGYLGDSGQLKQLQEYISDKSKIMIAKTCTDLSLYERHTLNLLHDDCTNQREDFYVLYLHTKGVKAANPYIKDWIELFHYFLIEKHQHCIQALSEQNCSVVGCNMAHWPSLHFSGNLWWASSRYIRTLVRTIGPEYLHPEMWVLSGKGKFMSCHDSRICHYEGPYPASKYVDKPYLDLIYDNQV